MHGDCGARPPPHAPHHGAGPASPSRARQQARRSPVKSRTEGPERAIARRAEWRVGKRAERAPAVEGNERVGRGSGGGGFFSTPAHPPRKRKKTPPPHPNPLRPQGRRGSKPRPLRFRSPSALQGGGGQGEVGLRAAATGEAFASQAPGRRPGRRDCAARVARSQASVASARRLREMKESGPDGATAPRAKRVGKRASRRRRAESKRERPPSRETKKPAPGA